MKLPFAISSSGRKAIDWERILLSAPAPTAGTPSDHTPTAAAASSAAVEALLDEQLDRVRSLFKVFREEFDKGVQHLRRLTTLITFGTATFLVAAIGGLVVASLARLPMEGGALGGVGLAGLLPMTFKLVSLHREITLLTILPSSYEVAVSLCRSQEQVDRLLDEMLADLRRLREGRISTSATDASS